MEITLYYYSKFTVDRRAKRYKKNSNKKIGFDEDSYFVSL